MSSGHAGAILTIDLGAIAANYGRLQSALAGVECAAVVKADAYGLGVARVAPILRQAGCRQFFVATFDEGVELRGILGGEAEIAIFNGLPKGAAADCRRHRLSPVLNSLAEIDELAAFARASGSSQTAILHCDTGMNRLGLDGGEVDALADRPERLEGIDVCAVMSHLACAEAPDHPLNRNQLARFGRCRARLPAAPASLVNSSGIFLGAEYHFDLARPGVALFGVNPTPGQPNPMREVVCLQARVLQVRDVDSPQTVGYGATHRITSPRRIATISMGYADGFPRSLSDRGRVACGDATAPVIGRVSMDMSVIDVGGLGPQACQRGDLVTVIGGPRPIETVAAEADTIAYEILTRLGRRHKRVYRGAERASTA